MIFPSKVIEYDTTYSAHIIHINLFYCVRWFIFYLIIYEINIPNHWGLYTVSVLVQYKDKTFIAWDLKYYTLICALLIHTRCIFINLHLSTPGSESSFEFAQSELPFCVYENRQVGGVYRFCLLKYPHCLRPLCGQLEYNIIHGGHIQTDASHCQLRFKLQLKSANQIRRRWKASRIPRSVEDVSIFTVDCAIYFGPEECFIQTHTEISFMSSSEEEVTLIPRREIYMHILHWVRLSINSVNDWLCVCVCWWWFCNGKTCLVALRSWRINYEACEIDFGQCIIL